MNREQRRAEAKKLKVKQKTLKYEQANKALKIIYSVINEKVRSRLEETNLDHVQINYVNNEALTGKTNMQYADFVAHDDKNNLDFLMAVVYFGVETIDKDQAVCIINTIIKEQENIEHEWVLSDKEDEHFYIDNKASYIDKLTIEKVSDDNE